MRINAVEPGVNLATGLGQRDQSGLAARYVLPLLVPVLMPFLPFLSTPKRAARVIARILRDRSGKTGVYYNERGRPMRGSPLVHDPKFQDRVVAETRALLSLVSG